MRDIKQAFWIAGQNFYGWKKSPRIWMTFILAAILCLMLSDQIISHAIKYEDSRGISVVPMTMMPPPAMSCFMPWDLVHVR